MAVFFPTTSKKVTFLSFSTRYDYWKFRMCYKSHDDVIKWKHFPRYWPFVRGIHRSRVNSPHKGQWRGALMFSLIYARMNEWVNNREAGDLRRHRAHYDVTVMITYFIFPQDGSIRHSTSLKCLTLDGSTLSLQRCDVTDARQRWRGPQRTYKYDQMMDKLHIDPP